MRGWDTVIAVEVKHLSFFHILLLRIYLMEAKHKLIKYQLAIKYLMMEILNFFPFLAHIDSISFPDHSKTLNC